MEISNTVGLQLKSSPSFPHQLFRTLLLGLALLFIGPFAILVSRSSGSERIALGLWSPGYFAVIATYAGCWLGYVILIFAATPAQLDFAINRIIWLRRHPLFLVILAILYEEGLFYIRTRLVESGYIASNKPTLFLDFALVYGLSTVLMDFLTLIGLFIGLVIVLTGRTRENTLIALRRTGIALLACFIGFILAALFYAMVIDYDEYRSGHDQWTVLAQPDDDLVYRHRANLRNFYLYFDHGLGSFTLSTNSLGFRGTHEITNTPVAVIGDSTVFGLEVNDNEVWSETVSSDLGVSVTNYGMPGYYWWQYNRVAERYATVAGHQVVMYALNGTDMTNDASFSGNTDLIRYWQTWQYKTPFHYTLNRFTELSPLTRLLTGLQRQGLLLPSVQQPKPFHCLFLTAPLENKDQRLIKQHIDQSIEIAERGGYHLVLVTIPGRASMYSSDTPSECMKDTRGKLVSEPAAYDFVCSYVRAQGGLCYDMTNDLRDASQHIAATDFFLPDGHWSPQGHAIIGHLLAAYIQNHHLLN